MIHSLRLSTFTAIAAALLSSSLLVDTADSAQADDAPKSQAELESLLLGNWVGGPCMGVISFAKDGTFEHRHYTPGNNELSGTWQLRWNALPPTLVLTCKTSDDSQSFPPGKTWNPKLISLDAENLVYRFDEEANSTFRRQSLDEAAVELTQGLVIYATLKQAIGTFSSFGIPQTGDTFTLDLANLPKEKVEFKRPIATDRHSYIPFHGPLTVSRLQEGKPNSGSSITVVELATPEPTKDLRIQIQFLSAVKEETKVRIVIYRAAGDFIGSMAEAEGVLK